MAGIYKNGWALSVVIFTYLCLSSLSHTASAEEKTKKAKKCLKPKHFAFELDYDWIMSHSKWYFPMMSRQDLLRQSSDILEKTLEEVSSPSNGILDAINSKACIQATWDGLTPIITGFNGKRTSYNLSPSDWTNFNILAFEKAWDKGQSGTLYITHSDNKNFVFFVRCWEDEHRTWMVMTTTELPTEKVKTKIVQHIKLLGFPEDDIELLDYETCSTTSSTTEPKSEL